MITGKDGKRYYKVALHIHTTLSDGRCTPEEVAQMYRAAGYDALAFTDHWTASCEGNMYGLHIIPGCEYNTIGGDTARGVMHIVALGMKDTPAIEKGSTPREIVDAINAAGGIAILPHPYWSLNSPEDVEGLDGIVATEIYNAVSEAGESMRAYSDYFIELCANRGRFFTIVAADDAHHYDGYDNCQGWVMVCADELSTSAIIDAIRSGSLYATRGPEIYTEFKDGKITVDTSEVSVISVQTNMAHMRGHTLRGDGLTHHEYTLLPNEKWVRAIAVDKNGKQAWSQIYRIGD